MATLRISARRTKIERLFSRMKERFKMKQVYKRGIDKIKGHILKFMNLMHILGYCRDTILLAKSDLRNLGDRSKPK